MDVIGFGRDRHCLEPGERRHICGGIEVSSSSSLAICRSEMPVIRAWVARVRARARPAIAVRSITPAVGRMMREVRSAVTTAAAMGCPRSVLQAACAAALIPILPVILSTIKGNTVFIMAALFKLQSTFCPQTHPLHGPEQKQGACLQRSWATTTPNGIIC
jgi:hypothetical protein